MHVSEGNLNLSDEELTNRRKCGGMLAVVGLEGANVWSAPPNMSTNLPCVWSTAAPHYGYGYTRAGRGVGPEAALFPLAAHGRHLVPITNGAQRLDTNFHSNAFSITSTTRMALRFADSTSTLYSTVDIVCRRLPRALFVTFTRQITVSLYLGFQKSPPCVFPFAIGSSPAPVTV